MVTLLSAQNLSDSNFLESAFVLCHLAATPVAGAVAALSEERRAALARQVGLALQAYADGEGVTMPDETYIAMAHT